MGDIADQQKKPGKKHRTKGSNRFIFLIFLSTALIIVSVLVLNDVSAAIRMLELKSFLRQINREVSNVDQLGLVTKYKLHLELYKDNIDEKKFDEEELKTASLIASFENNNELTLQKYKNISGPVIFFINIVRIVLRKPSLKTVYRELTNKDLTIAYYYERNKRYEKALEIYKSAIEENRIEEDKIPLAMLHEAFCYSVLGDTETAKKRYREIMANYGEMEIALTAAILLQYLEEIQREIVKVKESNESSIEKTEKLLKLSAYNDAIAILDNVNIKDEKQKNQVKFYKARLYEETGNQKESVKIYQELIQEEHNSEMAKLSNRRILVMSSVDEREKGEKLEKLAKRNNALIGDDSFKELVDTREQLEKAKEEVRKLSMPEPVTAAKDVPLEGEEPADREVPETPPPEIWDELELEEEPAAEELDLFLDDSIEEAKEKIIEIQGEEAWIEYEKEEATPTPPPTASPEPETKIIATPEPTEVPTTEPTQVPTPIPTEVPTPIPTEVPTPIPTQVPTPIPARVPTPIPTQVPTPIPTRVPTPEPTLKPPYTIEVKNENGLVYKVEQYDGNDNLIGYIEYELDETGIPIKVNSYDADGNPLD